MSKRKDIERIIDDAGFMQIEVPTMLADTVAITRCYDAGYDAGYIAGLRAALRAIRDDAYAADAREDLRAMIARRRKG